MDSAQSRWLILFVNCSKRALAGAGKAASMTGMEQSQAVPPLSNQLPAWLDYLLAQRGLSPRTVESYGQDLESFFLFEEELAQSGGSASCLDEQEIFLYLAWLRSRGNTGARWPAVFPP